MRKKLIRAAAAVVAGIAAICGMTFGIKATKAYTIYTANTVKRLLPIYSVDRSDNKIAISFDCAWGVEHTDEILENLAKYKVKATFFAVQFWVEKYPDYVKKIADAGLEIGTHSKTHPHMSKLSAEGIKAELSSSKAAIESACGKEVTLFRPPFGDYNDRLIKACKELGLYAVQWDVDSLDWKDLSARQIAARVLGKVKSGSIILMHNNGLHTAEALPLIFEPLLAQGYEFVTIGELIYKDNYEIRADGTQYRV